VHSAQAELKSGMPDERAENDATSEDSEEQIHT
jgi:hypothetical protein